MLVLVLLLLLVGDLRDLHWTIAVPNCPDERHMPATAALQHPKRHTISTEQAICPLAARWNRPISLWMKGRRKPLCEGDFNARNSALSEDLR